MAASPSALPPPPTPPPDTVSFESILLSRPLKFLVGPNEVEVVVHEEAIANLSPALNVLMRGRMSESTTGIANWTEVDERTFTRFAQFAYTGDYSVPKMVVSIELLRKDPREVEAPAELASPAEDEDYLGWGMPRLKSKKKGSKKDLFPETKTYTRFKSLTYNLLQPRSRFEEACQPSISGESGAENNIIDALLSHTLLYILADKWGVESLKVLTLYKLHQSLEKLNFRAAFVADIVKLVRQGYSHTMDLDTGIDSWRELICQFIAANIKIMSKEQEFMTLIENGGAFVRDLWQCVLPRVE